MASKSAQRVFSAPFRIALLYAVIGFAWIAVSDVGLLRFGATAENVWEVGLLKGLIFIIVTATALFLLIGHEVRRRQKVTARLEAVLQAAPLGIAYIDDAGMVAQWNEAAAHILGVAPDDAVGRSARDVGLDIAEPALASGRDVTLTATDGRSVPVRLFRRAGIEGGGEVVVFYDRSQDLDIELAQRQLQKLQAIGRLAGGVAHDFNNLLTAVLGHAVLLADAVPADDPLQDHVEEIRRAALRGAGVTRQLLVVSGRSVSRPELLPVSDFIRDLQPVLARAAGEDVEIEFDLEPDGWHVQCDAAQLEQVLINLVVNGREAMPDGGAIAVAATNAVVQEDLTNGVPAGDYVRIVVRDTGRGMDAETQLHLFEPFFTTKRQGTGLGLATVYGVLQQYDGHIRVRSQPGAGSEFELFFPRAPAPAAAPPTLSPDTGPAGTLLVVEDDDLVRDLTCRLLRRGGHEVLAARDAAEALEIAQRRLDIELVVADIIMPGMNGIDLGKRLREQRPSLPILLTSGYTAGSLLDEAELDDDTQFLAKPYRPEELLSRVRDLLAAARTG